MLRLSVRHGVKSPHSHNLPNSLSATVVGIRVGTEHTTQVRLEPELIRSRLLLAALVNTVGQDGTGNGNVHAHVETGEGIVTAIGKIGKISFGPTGDGYEFSGISRAA